MDISRENIQEKSRVTCLCIDDDHGSWWKIDVKCTEGSEKNNTFFESIPKNIRLYPRGLLPSGALSTHPMILSNKATIWWNKSRYNVFKPILEIRFFDYSLRGYSHRERWARTWWCFSWIVEQRRWKMIWKASLLPSGGSFYQSSLNNPNILYIETVKQGCDLWFSSCVITTKLECHGWNISWR
jgi:hypothetical protein